MIKSLLDFIRNPVYEIDLESGLETKLMLLGKLLVLALLISFSIGMLIGILEQVTELELGEHAMDRLFEEYSPSIIFMVAIVIAPILEELLFRGPLYLFRQNRYFNYIFYVFTLAFGFYHITNFEISPSVLYLSPLLVSPQLVIGLLLGYIRIRLGLGWAIILHALYNLVLVGPIIIIQILEIPLP